MDLLKVVDGKPQKWEWATAEVAYLGDVDWEWYGAELLPGSKEIGQAPFISTREPLWVCTPMDVIHTIEDGWANEHQWIVGLTPHLLRLHDGNTITVEIEVALYGAA